MGLALLSVAACYNPTFQEGRPCTASGSCPGDLVCNSQLLCVFDGAQGETDGGGGVGVNDGTLVVLPDSKDFGTILINQSSGAVEFEVVATGNVKDVSASITDGTPFAILDDGCTGLDMIEGQVCTVSVVFSPITKGLHMSLLTIDDKNVPLLGNGLLPGDLKITPGTIAFGTINVGSSSPERSFKIVNEGGAMLTGVTPQLANAGGPYSIVGTNCSTLTAGQSCGVTIVFAPIAGGNTTNNLNVMADGGEQTVATMSGKGFQATFRLMVSVNVVGSGGAGNISIVTSNPSGIICTRSSSSDCQEDFPNGATVTLDAEGDFDAWSGDCLGAGGSPVCTLTMNKNQSVGARFLNDVGNPK